MFSIPSNLIHQRITVLVEGTRRLVYVKSVVVQNRLVASSSNHGSKLRGKIFQWVFPLSLTTNPSARILDLHNRHLYKKYSLRSIALENLLLCGKNLWTIASWFWTINNWPLALIRNNKKNLKVRQTGLDEPTASFYFS